MTQPKRRTLLLLVLVLAAIWFSNLDYRKLIRPDEGRYAEIAREMAVSGDWITPRLNGIKYFEKPPLQYWATAAAFRAFGVREWTARLWPALTGFLGILLIGFLGSRLYGTTAGFYAGLVTASAAGYIGMGHLNTLDMGLTFFMTATLAGFLLAHRTGASPIEERRWMLAAWASAALAVLSKGLIGVVLPAGAAAIYILIERDFRLLRRCHCTAGITIFLLIGAPWFVLAQLDNPEFARFFFVHEHFQRFLTTVHRRVEPWWYFLPVLAIGLWPWFTLLPQAFAKAWRVRDPAAAFQPGRFLLIWAVFIFVFFSFSHSKLMSYILPIFPALALLVAARLAQLESRSFFWHALTNVVIGLLILALSPLAVRLARPATPPALVENYVPWIAAGGLAILTGAGLCLLWSRGNRPLAALIAMALGSLVGVQLIGTGHNALSPAYSGYYLAQAIKPYLDPALPIFSVKTYDQTLPFYIERTVTLVAHDSELNYGLEQEPQLGVPTLAQFERAWRQAPRALAIMEPLTYTMFEQKGLPMRIIARDPRRIVIAKPEPPP
jgi:4-amino-4-deoxy-L-arabinose transferase-like glycosyltransferase